MPTSPKGILPDFIVIGAMRAGTTSLYKYLNAHPAIGMSEQKETDFFIEELNWDRGLDWYSGQFKPGFEVYGEVSPNYTKALRFPGVPARIASVVPQSRLIYVLRDPIKRAVSHYTHLWLHDPATPPPEALTESDSAWRNIVDTSRYHRQLSEFLAHHALENIFVIEFEAFTRDPAPTLSALAKFIGVDDRWDRGDGVRTNTSDQIAQAPAWLLALQKNRAVADVGRRLPGFVKAGLNAAIAWRKPREAPGFGPEAQARIAEAVAPDAEKLRRLTGLAFDSWTV